MTSPRKGGGRKTKRKWSLQLPLIYGRGEVDNSWVNRRVGERTSDGCKKGTGGGFLERGVSPGAGSENCPGSKRKSPRRKET